MPTEILTKPGRPTDAEWDVLRRHPEFGAELVAPLCELAGGMVTGGPHSITSAGTARATRAALTGDEIALPGRIVAVADVFDVITSARSYKEPFASTAARDEIAHCAGTQFDPRVVRAFLNISLGRLRLVMGPLSWLAHVPMLGRLPLTPAIGTVTASLGTVAAALTSGLVATPPAPGLAGTVPNAAETRPAAHALRRVVDEDQSVRVGVEAAGGGARVTALSVSKQPSVGRIRVTAGLTLVYTPPPNFSGDVSVGYRACWAGRGCRQGEVLIRVVPVNDPPTARNDAAATGRATPVSIDVLANDTDPDGDRLSIGSISRVGVGSARVADGKIRWSPPSRFTGTTTFRYTATDRHGGSSSALVTVRVAKQPGPVAPASVAGPPPPLPQSQPPPQAGSGPAATTPAGEPSPADRPPQAVADQLSAPEGSTVVVDVLANDRDPDGDPISIVSVGSPSRGTAHRVGDRVQFIAPSDYVGRVSFPYTIADSQGARDSALVSVSVLLVNAAPAFTPGPDQSVLEDSGPQTVPGWARNVGPGATSEAGQTVSFAVTSDNSGLFTTPPALTADGTLTYAPAPNKNGTATVTVRASDDGGTANGGVDTSAPTTFTITVRPVNDAPSFTAGADQTVFENAGAVRVAGWATGIVAGPADESGQTVDFLVSNSRTGLFTADGQPHVAANGTLGYTPAANANGTATVTVRARDDGGTADGGDDTSPAQTFTITIRAVNSSPSFTAGPDQTVAEDAGPQTVPGWATGISPGPADESAQTVSFLVSNGNTGLFSAQPSVAANGTLSYTAAANANGSATVTVRAKDDGGTANGGSDTSAAQTFTITVTPLNDPPVANADSATVAEDDPTGVTFDVLANDTDVDAGTTLSVSSFDGSTIADGTLTDNGGGSFTYLPDPGFNGSESFSYVASDGSGGTATATVTITVTAVPHAPGRRRRRLQHRAGHPAHRHGARGTRQRRRSGRRLAHSADDTRHRAVQRDSGPRRRRLLHLHAGQRLQRHGLLHLPDRRRHRPQRRRHGDDHRHVGPDARLDPLLPAQRPVARHLGHAAEPGAGRAAQLADFDGDGKQGLTIKYGDGKETINESAKYQIWTYTAPSPLLLNGPVTLEPLELHRSLRLAQVGHALCLPLRLHPRRGPRPVLVRVHEDRLQRRPEEPLEHVAARLGPPRDHDRQRHAHHPGRQRAPGQAPLQVERPLAHHVRLVPDGPERDPGMSR